MTDIWVLYSTFPSSEEALSVAQALVDGHLVACANVVSNVTSVYRWQGAVQKDSEVILFAKTQSASVDAAIAKIRALHSYDTPCITSWPLAKGHGDFLKWVKDGTSS